MKNRSGQAAALLTLGLVIVGGLLTIGISYFTNSQKIATNSRAASCTMYDCSKQFGSQYTGSVCYQGSDFYSGTCGATGCTGSPYSNGWHGGCVASSPGSNPPANPPGNPSPPASAGGGNGDSLTPDRLCCKTYSCGAYGASPSQMMVKVLGFTGTYKGVDGYTSCATTGYSNVQQCSAIPGAPSSNGATGFVDCPGASSPPGQGSGGANGNPNPPANSGNFGYCCVVYKQGLYTNVYGCSNSSSYVVKAVGFYGTNKDGTEGYTSCATTGYEKYSGVQQVGDCANISGAESLTSGGTTCVADANATPVQQGSPTLGGQDGPCYPPGDNPNDQNNKNFSCDSPLVCSSQDGTGSCSTSQGGSSQSGGVQNAGLQSSTCPSGLAFDQCTFGQGDSASYGPATCGPNKKTENNMPGCNSTPSGKQCSDFTDIYSCDGSNQTLSCAWDGKKCLDTSSSSANGGVTNTPIPLNVTNVTVDKSCVNPDTYTKCSSQRSTVDGSQCTNPSGYYYYKGKYYSPLCTEIDVQNYCCGSTANNNTFSVINTFSSTYHQATTDNGQNCYMIQDPSTGQPACLVINLQP
ncbi:hypothetical protein M1328_05520 [Patescibacteria group bacterium]|nr:hypothetical protein [Patescibacteria group bacterium]